MTQPGPEPEPPPESPSGRIPEARIADIIAELDAVRPRLEAIGAVVRVGITVTLEMDR